MVQPDKKVLFRALGASALFLGLGVADKLDAGYIGCAESCNGQYCWGEKTTNGCMETTWSCVLYHSGSCC